MHSYLLLPRPSLQPPLLTVLRVALQRCFNDAWYEL